MAATQEQGALGYMREVDTKGWYSIPGDGRKSVVITKGIRFSLSPKAAMRLLEIGDRHIRKRRLKEYVAKMAAEWREQGLGRLGGGWRKEFYHDDVVYDEEYVYLDLHKDADFGGAQALRSCTLLVKVVRELRDEANGRQSGLKIVNIPNDAKYSIELYEMAFGEQIVEKHRTWD